MPEIPARRIDMTVRLVTAHQGKKSRMHKYLLDTIRRDDDYPYTPRSWRVNSNVIAVTNHTIIKCIADTDTAMPAPETLGMPDNVRAVCSQFDIVAQFLTDKTPILNAVKRCKYAFFDMRDGCLTISGMNDKFEFIPGHVHSIDGAMVWGPLGNIPEATTVSAGRVRMALHNTASGRVWVTLYAKDGVCSVEFTGWLPDGRQYSTVVQPVQLRLRFWSQLAPVVEPDPVFNDLARPEWTALGVHGAETH
jgi:hypothetical protein